MDISSKRRLRSNLCIYLKRFKAIAKLQVIRLKNRTRVLKTHIRSGKIVPEINKENIRELIEGNYRIIYKIVEDNRIDILTIHHSARDLTRRKIE